MKALAMIGSMVRAYPYRERVPRALGALGAILWARWARGDLWLTETLEGYLITGALLLTFLCKPRCRPFWFFAGIAVGAVLLGLVDVFGHHVAN